MHHKVIHEYSRQFWGSPFEIERQGNDQNAWQWNVDQHHQPFNSWAGW
jgi:hypothetical protein